MKAWHLFLSHNWTVIILLCFMKVGKDSEIFVQHFDCGEITQCCLWQRTHWRVQAADNISAPTRSARPVQGSVSGNIGKRILQTALCVWAGMKVSNVSRGHHSLTDNAAQALNLSTISVLWVLLAAKVMVKPIQVMFIITDVPIKGLDIHTLRWVKQPKYKHSTNKMSSKLHRKSADR